MLFKLSLKNMKKSFKDYAIYFLTLILGVAIFYMFNSIDSQQAMLKVSESTQQLIKLMIDMLNIVSVFIAVILGFLIVYANNFLIKRRKKEFGIYMSLGMGKRQISKILLIETILIGIISLIVGMILGIFCSQFMSILVGKMFRADMTDFQFIFSKDACIKTCIYFGVMYLAVMIFNMFTTSKYKLIDLMTAIKKNEKIKIKNPFICVIVFIIAVIILGYAYYKVTGDINLIASIDKLLGPIIMGCISTFLIFWSLSGFILKLVQSNKRMYLKGTNMFVLRQLNSKVNTMVVSMTIICLMLFVTITVLSTAVSLNNSIQTDLAEVTPVDANFYKEMDLPEVSKYGKKYSENAKKDSKITISETFKNSGIDMNIFKDIVDFETYTLNELKLNQTLGNSIEKVKEKFPIFNTEIPEEIIKVSDYNRVAKLYGINEYTLNDNEYIIICDYDNVKSIRDEALKQGTDIIINNKTYKPKYDECQSGYILMSTSHTNTGIIVVPDSFKISSNMRQKNYFIANYNTDTEEGKREIEDMLSSNNSVYVKKMKNEFDTQLDGFTKIMLYESSIGVSSLVSFIAIYLGVIFLISSSAILALKELSESSDNKQRYTILRKIGVDEKMINKSLFKQIGIFFIIPLILATIHSVFGIQFARNIFGGFSNLEDLTVPIIYTAVFIVMIYGGYFIATYLGSKNIIRDDK